MRKTILVELSMFPVRAIETGTKSFRSSEILTVQEPIEKQASNQKFI